MRFPLTLLILLILGTCVRAQKSEDLREDSAIFEQQAQRYQKWLDRTGLGQYLKYRELDVEEHQLTIYLEFRSGNVDTIVNYWQKLKEYFEADSPISLEQQLFYKANNLMEVPQSTLHVQLYDTFDLLDTPLFFRKIFFREGGVRVQQSDPKARIPTIRLTPKTIEGKPLSVAEYQAKLPREKVYSCIEAYAKSRYRNRGLDGKVPEIIPLEKDEVLRFEVIDIRQEVLPAGLLPRWAKRELLLFRFTYELSDMGIRITGDIDGKFGSGFYRSVGRGAYQPMGKEYEADLEAYIAKITMQIKTFLGTCP